MLESIIVALLLALAGVLVWAFQLRTLLRRQLASRTQEVAQVNQAAETAEKEYEAKLASAGQLQQTLEETKKHLELVQKATDDILYDLEVASGTLQWNDALYTRYGYERSEAVNTVEWWADHIHPDDAMKLNEVMSGLADPAAPGWEVEYRFRKADNEYVWVRDRSFVLRNQGGEATHLIGSIRDVASQQQSGKPAETSEAEA